jgi:hypothetical protein
MVKCTGALALLNDTRRVSISVTSDQKEHVMCASATARHGRAAVRRSDGLSSVRARARRPGGAAGRYYGKPPRGGAASGKPPRGGGKVGSSAAPRLLQRRFSVDVFNYVFGVFGGPGARPVERRDGGGPGTRPAEWRDGGGPQDRPLASLARSPGPRPARALAPRPHAPYPPCPSSDRKRATPAAQTGPVGGRGAAGARTQPSPGGVDGCGCGSGTVGGDGKTWPRR